MSRTLETAEHPPATVLIVDDHLKARQWLRQAVRVAFPQADVREAGSLKQAHGLLDCEHDLAILDVGLPDGSGLDLIAPLVTAGSQVVIASVLADDDTIFAALQRGCEGYIHKDDEQNRLTEMLLGIVGGQPPLSPAIARRVLNYFSQGRVTAPAATEEEAPSVQLTPREHEVLTLLAKGYTVRNVAEMLEIKYFTAAGYAKELYRKLKVSSRAEATAEAMRRGLLR